MCEIKASAKWYARNIGETPVDRALSKVVKYLKENDLFAIPYD